MQLAGFLEVRECNTYLDDNEDLYPGHWRQPGSGVVKEQSDAAAKQTKPKVIGKAAELQDRLAPDLPWHLQSRPDYLHLKANLGTERRRVMMT